MYTYIFASFSRPIFTKNNLFHFHTMHLVKMRYAQNTNTSPANQKGLNERAKCVNSTLASRSVWMTSKQLLGCSSHSLKETPTPAPATGEPVWIAAGCSRLLNGPQSAGETGMVVGATEGVGGRGDRGSSVWCLGQLNRVWIVEVTWEWYECPWI